MLLLFQEPVEVEEVTPGQATGQGTSPTATGTLEPGAGAATAAGVSPAQTGSTPAVTPGLAIAAGDSIGATDQLTGPDTPRSAQVQHPGPTTATFQAPQPAAAPVRADAAATFERPTAIAAFEQAQTEIVLT